MRWTCEGHGPASIELVLRRLHDVSGWTVWLPAVEVQMSRLERVQLVLSTPRPLRVLVSALQHANGLELRMLSGDFTAFWSRLQVSDEEGLTALNWEQVFDLPVNVPGTLLKELRTEVVPGILARLLSEEASHE